MSDTQTIKDRIDIVHLVQEYVPLKKAGVNWKANCPFHHEKTPSFMVHQEKQFWHCFGCQKGGDIFTFLQEMEGIDFPEALKILADRAGVKLQSSYQSELQKSQKNRLLEINSKAAYFFHNFLIQMPSAQAARDYLEKRGLKKETIDEWQIGFVPEQWNLLTQYLLKKGCGIDDLIASGLTIKREGADIKSGRGYYDRFRGRIMFPIWDVHGNVMGFTGRILVETENSGGKYVNTPQTPVYDKSRALFGLNKAKLEIKAKDEAVVVEGQMDVIACHAAGMKNVVASSGTALTAEQVRFLKRYASNIAVAFDTDTAGEDAAKRGIIVAVQEGMRARVIQIPSGAGKDADECLKKNPQIWFEAVKNAKEVMEWHIAATLEKANLETPRGKQQAAAALILEVSRIPYPVERDHWLGIVADKLDVEIAVLREEMKRSANRPSSQRGPMSPGRSANIDKSDELSMDALRGERKELLLENFWALIIKYPQFFGELSEDLKPEYFIHTPYQVIYETCKKLYTIKNIAVDALKAHCAPQGGENLIDVLLLKGETYFFDNSEQEALREVKVLVSEIHKEWLKERKEELLGLIKKAEQEKDAIKVRGLLKEITELG